MAEAFPLVVKLGGSLFASPQRSGWIAALRQYPGPLTLVCGGGSFADAVRAAQPAMGFDNVVAHAMAVLAMEQCAMALASLHEGLAPAATPAEISGAHKRGRIALWRPAIMVAAARDIAPGWDVTSDSLSAWLARRLDAPALLLIKSVDIGKDHDASTLAQAGVVDPAFPAYAGLRPVFVAGPKALQSAPTFFRRGDIPGARVGAKRRKTA
ncbi:MAG: uridylate kinase [Methylocystis sp.]|nr:uridylate kinase [Methylocystis sp.]